MTIEGVIAELQGLIDNPDMPVYMKPSIKKIIETVEQERKRHLWILYSERLPEESGLYLAWVLWEYEDNPMCEIINFDADCNDFGDWEYHYDGITHDCIDSRFIPINQVIAWQPLPEPYRESEESE